MGEYPENLRGLKIPKIPRGVGGGGKTFSLEEDRTLESATKPRHCSFSSFCVGWYCFCLFVSTGTGHE